MTRSRRFSALALTAAVGLVLTACTSTAPTDGVESSTGRQTATVGDAHAVLEAYGWGDLTGGELVETLEALPLDERPADLVASVRSTDVVVQTADAEPVSLPIDEGFYLSVAPYRTQTHPCSFHSPTTCLGELGDEPVTITAVDAATGEQVLAVDTRTEANGFVGVWLPRDRDLTVTVDAPGGSATTAVATGADDPTCLTTMQLT